MRSTCLLILHVDHEQNCSARPPCAWWAAARRTSLPRSSAAICGPVGPACMGAQTRRCIEMLEGIQANGGRLPDAFLEKVDRTRKTVLAAHGVRPSGLQELRPARTAPQDRLPIVSSRRARVFTDPLLDLAKNAWKTWRWSDDYFIQRKLYPNVDFYSGIIYRAMGFPTDMFTVLFALGRPAGVDRAVEGDARRPEDADQPAAAGLHRRHGAPLRAAGITLIGPPSGPCGPGGGVSSLKSGEVSRGAVVSKHAGGREDPCCSELSRPDSQVLAEQAQHRRLRARDDLRGVPPRRDRCGTSRWPAWPVYTTAFLYLVMPVFFVARPRAHPDRAVVGEARRAQAAAWRRATVRLRAVFERPTVRRTVLWIGGATLVNILIVASSARAPSPTWRRPSSAESCATPSCSPSTRRTCTRPTPGWIASTATWAKAPRGPSRPS